MFENLLHDLRKKKGFTQQELADKVYTSFQTISNYEKGKRKCTFDMGVSLLNALDTSIIIENNCIKLKESSVSCMNNFLENNLEFISFDVYEEKYLANDDSVIIL